MHFDQDLLKRGKILCFFKDDDGNWRNEYDDYGYEFDPYNYETFEGEGEGEWEGEGEGEEEEAEWMEVNGDGSGGGASLRDDVFMQQSSAAGTGANPSAAGSRKASEAAHPGPLVVTDPSVAAAANGTSQNGDAMSIGNNFDRKSSVASRKSSAVASKRGSLVRDISPGF